MPWSWGAPDKCHLTVRLRFLGQAAELAETLRKTSALTAQPIFVPSSANYNRWGESIEEILAVLITYLYGWV